MKATAEKREPVIQASRELLDRLNDAIARELQVAIQYMWQHVQWHGVGGFAVHGELRSIGIAEMKHAETIADRLFYLGGTPTTKPNPIFVGQTTREMIERDAQDEENAINLYREIIKLARDEGDETTAHLFRRILEEEEAHHNTFISLLESL